jgi:hypothetical protein
MRLDEIVIYKGCPHLVRGLQPMSVPDPRVEDVPRAVDFRRRSGFDGQALTRIVASLIVV